MIYMYKAPFFVLLMVIFSGCKREVQENQVLMSHPWHLASTRIIVYDTATLQGYFPGDNITPSTVLFMKDTNFVPDPCVSQSDFSFRQNNLLHLTDNCVAGSPVTDTTWWILPENRLLLEYMDDTVTYGYIARAMFNIVPPPVPFPFHQIINGLVIKMTSSQFVLNLTSTGTTHTGSYRNNVLIDSFVRIRVEQYLTFNSR
jgi:hypothetical protein